MSFTEALITYQTTKPCLGAYTVPHPSCCSCMSEAADLWEKYVDLLGEASVRIEQRGGRVVSVRANKVFFEADVMIDGAEHFDSPEDFQADMEDTPDVSMDVEDSEGALEGFEISGEDWTYVEAFGKGEQPDIDSATEEWLTEVGLIEKTQKGWGLTQFAQDWLKSSVDS